MVHTRRDGPLARRREPVRGRQTGAAAPTGRPGEREGPTVPTGDRRSAARPEGARAIGPDLERLVAGGPPVRPVDGGQRPPRPEPVQPPEAAQRPPRPAPPAGRVHPRRDRPVTCRGGFRPRVLRRGRPRPADAVPRRPGDRVPGGGVGRPRARLLRPRRRHAGGDPPRGGHEEPQGRDATARRRTRRGPAGAPGRAGREGRGVARDVARPVGRHAAGRPHRGGGPVCRGRPRGGRGPRLPRAPELLHLERPPHGCGPETGDDSGPSLRPETDRRPVRPDPALRPGCGRQQTPNDGATGERIRGPRADRDRRLRAARTAQRAQFGRSAGRSKIR
jgi:hypothetical protein